MSQTATGINWAESLHPGEQVLWQGNAIAPGRPDLPVRFFSLLGTILSLGSLLFILIAFLGRSQPDFVVGFGGIGAVALIVGLTCRFLPRRLQIARLRRSRYALTDRRMLAHDGAKLRDWPITPKLELEVLRDSVLVAPPEDPRLPNRPYRETGFIAIAEPRQVADMIKDIQSRQAGRTETAP